MVFNYVTYNNVRVNPVTPKISLVILLTVCQMILIMSVWEFSIGSISKPIIDIFLYSHHLSARYCTDIVRRYSALVTHSSLKIKSQLTSFHNHRSIWSNQHSNCSCSTSATCIASCIYSNVSGNNNSKSTCASNQKKESGLCGRVKNYMAYFSPTCVRNWTVVMNISKVHCW